MRCVQELLEKAFLEMWHALEIWTSGTNELTSFDFAEGDYGTKTPETTESKTSGE